MENKKFKERRKYARLKASVEVKYTIIGKPGELQVFSKDISAGGLCVVAEKEFPIDTPLQLEIKMPDLQDPVQALGRVVWQKKIESAGDHKPYYNVGLEFTGISDFDRFNINRYIKDRIEPKA